VFGREQFRRLSKCLGGSFGIVYKALERATGELVAVKHVGIFTLSPLAFEKTHPRSRLISTVPMMTSETSNKKSTSSAHALVAMLPNIRKVSCVESNYG